MSFSFPLTFLNFLRNEDLKPKTIKKVLSDRKKHFAQEYLKMNNVSISSSCYVKTDYIYRYGHLTLYNTKLTINQFETNKINTTYDQSNFNRSITSFIKNDNNYNNLKLKEDIFHPIFFIDFNMVTCQLVIHKSKKKFRLIILGRNTTDKDFDNDEIDYIVKYRIVKFKMIEASESQFKLICEAINKSIILSNGYKKNIFSINLRKNFCNEYFINYKEFALKGNTGDIILFRGYARESKLQRLITSADYDHVGILFRKDNVLHLYESTGKEGVKLRPWSEFITYLWYLLYEKMAFRPLKITEARMNNYVNNERAKYNLSELVDLNKFNENDIKQQFYYFLNKNINDFIGHTEDKKYSFSKTGYICNTTMRKNTINRKGYSCSELVAACYYYSGIITDKLEATNYFPGNFSRDGNMAFKPGFYFGEEYIIDFANSPYSV